MWAVIILFVAGIVLLFSEFFIPGAIVGTVGVILIVASCGYGWYLYPDLGLFIVLGEFVGLVVCVGAGFYVISNTRMRDFLVLSARQDAAKGWRSPAQSPDLVGKTGTVSTALRPAGKIVIGDQRIDAVSNGTFIDADAEVRVIEVEGHRVVVERAEMLNAGGDA